ncbi:hypothetical protein KY385_01160 [Candidatus Parcubacteria bacterium]|nr:hypothetical protein [Candidatus Parcubacteria bacterium]
MLANIKSASLMRKPRFSHRTWRNKFASRLTAGTSPALSCKKKRALRLAEGGFNLVELNIAMGVAAVLSVAFLTIFTTFLVTATRTNDSIDMTAKSQILLRSLVEELRYGAGVRDTNSIDDPNLAGTTGEWTTSNADTVLITAVPAEDSSGAYIIDPDTGSPYYNEYVYYKEGSILYKRTLANASATGNTAKTSCGTETPTCPADRKLIETLDSMVFALYDQDDALTTVSTEARSIKIDLSLNKNSYGKALTFDNSIRITLRNVF